MTYPKLRLLAILCFCITFLMQGTNQVEGAEFLLEKLVPRSAFKTGVPCNGCRIANVSESAPENAPTEAPIRSLADRCSSCKMSWSFSCTLCTFITRHRLETSAKQQQNAFQLVVMAIGKARTISPTITYTGTVGGEGCTLLQRLLGVPGCEVTEISGSAKRIQTIVTEGPFARFRIYQVPAGANFLRMTIPRTGSCGRRSGSRRCRTKSRSFSLSGGIDGTTSSAGCTRVLYHRKKRVFLRCRWSGCTAAQFGTRVYNDVTSFKRVTMSGSEIRTCASSTAENFFTL